MGWGRTSAAHPQEKGSRLTGVKQFAESRLWGAKFCYCGGLLGFRKLQVLRPFHRKIQDLSEVYLATRAGV